MASAASNSSLQIIEGESARVCVLLLEPEQTEFETEVDMSVQLSAGFETTAVCILTLKLNL